MIATPITHYYTYPYNTDTIQAMGGTFRLFRLYANQKQLHTCYR